MACTLRACCRVRRIGCEQRTSHFLLRQPQPLLSNFSQYSTSHTGASAISTTATSKHVRFLQTCSPRLRSQRDTPSEPPPTDFNEMDMLRGMPAPSTSVDVCMYDGFGLNSGITITNGDGALLVHGEAFRWRPWEARGSLVLTNKKGQFDIPFEAFGLFDLLWPRPGKLYIMILTQLFFFLFFPFSLSLFFLSLFRDLPLFTERLAMKRRTTRYVQPWLDDLPALFLGMRSRTDRPGVQTCWSSVWAKVTSRLVPRQRCTSPSSGCESKFWIRETRQRNLTCSLRNVESPKWPQH